jgi:tryptophan 2,3-dioxygenase
MACPMGYGVRFQGGDIEHERDQPLPPPKLDDGEGDVSQKGVNKATMSNNGVTYRDYLQLEKLLDCQAMKSADQGLPVPDEHLFIIIHQTYELWFKQIIFDIDHVRMLLNNKIVDETKTLQIVSLLERTVRILKLLADQILILETMSPLDFVEFRKYLTSASGFQSLQFRLLENKLGVKNDHRVKYNQQHYRDVFRTDKEMEDLVDSETQPSLFKLVEKWLERTPGVMSNNDDEDDFDSICNDIKNVEIKSDSSEDEITTKEKLKNSKIIENGTHEKILENGTRKKNNNVTVGSTVEKKGFWPNYVESVGSFLNDMKKDAENPHLSQTEQRQLQQEYEKTKFSFETILSDVEYNKYVKTQERRLSHDALKGALMIYFYRDMPRFSQPYQILTFLMDIDSLLQKWRYNHVMLVQRMLGSKQGTGGSSGYLYLRTTVSDRYKVFIDLFNLSTWLIPRVYIPKLSKRMVRTLSHHSSLNANWDN